MAQLGPCFPSVFTLINSTSRTSSVETPSATESLVSCGIKNARIFRVYYEVDCSGVIINKQGLFPRLATIYTAKNTSCIAGLPQISQCSDIYNIRICRVDYYFPDVASLRQSKMCPCVSAVIRTIDTVAPGSALPIVLFASSSIDDIRVRRCYCDISKGADSLLSKGVLPGMTSVGCLPITAGPIKRGLNVARSDSRIATF